MKSFLFLVGAVIIIGAGWYFVSPLLLNKEIDEDFPEVSTPALVPTPEELAVMSPEELDAKEEDIMAVAAAMPDTVMEEEMPQEVEMAQEIRTEPVVLASGIFKDADSFHKGSGNATIYELFDETRVLRLEDFSVTNGPDLRVLLVAHADPKTSDDVTGSAYIELDRLKGNKGNQNYELPAGTDVSAYGSVVIYCKPFHVVFSTAPLK